jgi:tetratricopeptide (TPR) repeat protein
VQIVRIRATSLIVGLVALGSPLGAQSSNWVAPRCDLKPGHYLVNSGLLYLQSATKTKFDEQRQKDLRDANRVLNQALTSNAQEKNPAAWYYLGRYYLLTNDAAGADTAFTRAEALKPDCKNDIETWRQTVWIPTLNAGIAAWQANNTDSAIKAFRAAAAINQSDPRGYKYLASLLFQAGQQDSAVYYFRRTAEVAAKDPKFAQDRKDALYNVGRIQQAMARAAQDSASKAKPDSISPRWNETLATYRQYLELYPNDAEILASAGSVMMQLGKRDSAFAVYKQIIARGDSVGAMPLFRAGVEIYQSAPTEPDTAAAGSSCRSAARANRLTPARVKVRCDSVTTRLARDYQTSAREAYRLSAQAFEAGARLNPHYRDGLFNLVNSYLVLNDSAGMLPTAQRLVSIDPMNRQSLRLLAFAHQRMGHVDSTVQYLRLADSTLVADVSITQFEPDSAGAQLKGMVQNLRSTPTPPMKLVFDFLTAKGDVVTSQTVEVPAVAPEQGHVFEIKGTGAGIAAWRYKKG